MAADLPGVEEVTGTRPLVVDEGDLVVAVFTFERNAQLVDVPAAPSEG